MSRYFIGLMSGTSADGMDAALVSVSENGQLKSEAAVFIPYEETNSRALRTAATSPSLDWNEYAYLDQLITDASIRVVNQLLAESKVAPSSITAIGSHGHTIRHIPPSEASSHSGRRATSYQIGDPNRIAEETGITCIADFRRRDMAAGGEGAPLVPAFHQVCFGQNTVPTMVLNLGGIANLSVLGDFVIGFDTGPGNCLMDEYCRTYLNASCDKGGELAGSGIIDQVLLNQLLENPYFELQPPKSTGRELFSLQNIQLENAGNMEHRDILATLTELTSLSITRAIEHFGHESGELLVCGGGVHNHHLMKRLEQLLPSHRVMSTADRGINPDWMEAVAFAWLAQQTIDGLPGNLTEVTGAKGKRVLGGIYPK